jgi:type I restriction enzyme S subunit
MSELPQGWVEAQLSDLGDSIKGSVQPSRDLTFELYSVPSFASASPEVVSGSEIGSHKRRVLPADLLICKINPRINRVWVVGERSEHDQLASPEWLVFRTPSASLARFLRYQLSAPHFRRWIEQAVHGVTGSHTRAKDDHILDFVASIPPEAEQERIVAAIEEAFSKLDAGEAGLRTVRQLLKRMRDAILTAAVTGRLVPQDPTDTPATKLLADLGVEPRRAHVPPGWSMTTVGSVFRVAVGTTPRRDDPSMWGGGVWWVSSGEVAFNRIRGTRETITSKAVLREERLLPPGTVMLAMIGEGRTRGQPAILEVPAAHNQNCASIRVEGTGVSSEWVFTFLASRYSETRRAGSGNNQPALNKRLIEAIEIPLPPQEEQARIVTEIERQLSFVDACERAVDAGLARSAALRRSVLKAAFEGRLVPQDPSDEPASVLLERIRAERAAAPGQQGKRRKKAEAS